MVVKQNKAKMKLSDFEIIEILEECKLQKQDSKLARASAVARLEPISSWIVTIPCLSSLAIITSPCLALQ